MADKPKKEKKYTPTDFQKGIDELSKKMGYSLNITPQLVQQDNGTFSIRITTNITENK